MADQYSEDPKSSDEANSSSDEEILRVARERFKLAEEAESEIRKLALEDLQFLAGDQWPNEVKLDRQVNSRPCLTINRMPQFIRQITNDQRQNRPSIKVSPVDDRADVETAKILQGLIRHIENNSSADVAYDTAFEGAVGPGFGYFRLRTDYVSPTSFEQEILIEPIKNQFSVYLDPFSKKPDGSDADWGFVFEDISRDDYKSSYKDSGLAKETDWNTLGADAPGWISDKGCRIAEYFYKEQKEITILQLSSGEVIEKSQFVDGIIGPDGVLIAVVNERKTCIPVVKWCKINGHEILEKTDWLGRWIPIIPVYGNELFVNGKRILEGIVRHAKDPQRMLNYWVSTETETIALAPKAPWIIAEGQIPEDYEYQWRTANSETHAYLTYKPTSLNGQPVPPPQRNVYEAPVQAITNARMQASEDLKATTGIYDAALGARSNENSGIAIQRRNQQSQTSNFHFIDNLTRSIKHAGRQLVDLIPKVYDTARAARIIGEEGQDEIVIINQVFEKQGKEVIYDLGAGKYDVTVETGPSYATKRQEAAATMMEFIKAVPSSAAVIPDLIAKNMDWPGSSEISERLKKTLPPGIIDDPNKQPIPPEVKAQMDQMGMLVDDLTSKLNQATETLKLKQNELESKERIEFAKLEQQATIELAKLESHEATTILAHQVSELNQRLKLLGMSEPIEQDFNEQMPDQQMPEMQEQLTGELPPGEPTGGFSPG